jgi:hypothetical protein
MTQYVTLAPHVHAILKQILDKSCIANATREAEHEEISQLLNNIATIILNNYSLERAPNLLRATNSGALSGNIYSFSVYNGGAANGTVLGGVIKPGETFNFNANGVNNFYDGANVTYDGTGTELVIIYNT